MVGGKPRMVIFNRADQADPDQTAAWKAWYRDKRYAVLETDAKDVYKRQAVLSRPI